MKTPRTYSPQTLEAIRILGTEVARGRRERQWSLKDLAVRAGITARTLSKIEHGDPTVGLGTAFEVASLIGVRLFNVDSSALGDIALRSNERLALLPQRVRQPKGPVEDDF